ncbi:MAG: cation-translocating P-type ATPase [Metamycoplasmataceae bacterium]
MKKKSQKNNENSDSPHLDIEEFLKTDTKNGLTDNEAVKRQEIFGKNILKKEKKTPFIVLFFKQFAELMSLLLLIAGLIALGLSIYENIINPNSSSIALSYAQASVLISIVVINALFGSIQESRSNNAIEELEKMTLPQAKVLRNGIPLLIESKDIVIGDILIVEAGDSISADAKLVEVSNLNCVESILTGESNAIEKNLIETNINDALGDQKNKIFSGTNVTNGRGIGIVYAIGNNTEIGKVAKLLGDKKALMTPLQYKLHRLGKVLGIIGIIITFITFLFSLLVIEDVINFGFSAVQPSLILAVSLAAAAIPEGLNAVVNIILAVGVKRMSAKNALIKKLPAVETLGSTAVICSDKTGTLTMNKMTIVKLWEISEENPDEDLKKISKLSEPKINLLKLATLCTDATVNEKESEKSSIGDPTEIAILDFAIKFGFSPLEWDKKFERIADIPFDSNRKLMTSINQLKDGHYAIVKGAPDVLIEKCVNGTHIKNKIKKINNDWSDNAIRVLAVAIKKVSNSDIEDLDEEIIESNLEFLGLIGMIDPPRVEVKRSIQDCIEAGIKPVMITGDHLNTAIAIAKDLGIIRNEKIQKSITGLELSKLDQEYLESHIEEYSVFARVSPEDKIRIVKAWQARDQVVAMTGDGVNDAPALKAADIGCAMGITGTDVSKGAADMILTDDNFATIVKAVKSGRSIYENIRKIVKFLLSSNIAGIISIVLGMMIFYFVFTIGRWGEISANVDYNGYIFNIEQANIINSNIKFQTTLTTIQILINNIVIETLPGVALGTQKSKSLLMNKRPRSKYESIFSDRLILKILLTGIISGLLTIVSFVLGSYIAIITGVPGLRFFYGNVAAFLCLTIGGVLKSISMSSSIALWKTKFSENKWVYLSSFISLIIIMISTFIPEVSSLFGERPVLNESIIIELNNASAGGSSINLGELNQALFQGRNSSTFINPYIILVGISLGFLSFLILEIEKMIENKFFVKKDELNISEFKIIPRPIPFSQKYPFFNKINFFIKK